MVYGLAHVDRSGRVADRTVTGALGWRGGDRLTLTAEAGVVVVGSATDLAGALRRAEAAHGEHEKRTGQRDDNWPDWYAAYMVAEQARTELPT